MEPDKEAQKVIESSQSGQVIKSLADLRIDKLETKLSQIEKLNNDLIAANKELYAFVANNYTQERPAEQKASADMSSHEHAYLHASEGNGGAVTYQQNQQNPLAGQVHEQTHLFANEGNGSAVTYQPSIGVVTPPTAPTDEPNVDNVMKLMGYNSPDGQ